MPDKNKSRPRQADAAGQEVQPGGRAPAARGPGPAVPQEPVAERLLERVNSPADLKSLSPAELASLADELRELIIQTVSRRGGHLASNLGVTELTVALHTVFDFTRDRLLWDVGHQCYAHKILTARRGRFDTLRQAGGLSGFPAPGESPYDLFATGHAGTAISTASGLAWADALRGAKGEESHVETSAGQPDRKVVAVVGDASIVNGLSLEAINNAGLLKRQFLVILNDNSMAIDVTQGAVARVLDKIRLTPTYAGIKQSTEQMLRRLPGGQGMTEALRHLKDGLRTAVHGERLFESLGFRYFGPINGHDMGALLTVLRRLAEMPYPVLLHVHTQKGRGCDYAVEDPCRFHSPAAHTVNGGVVEFAHRPRPTWTEVFSRALLERARHNDRLVAITAAMPDGTGLAAFRDELPDRYIDVGISEAHAVALSAGLARAGLRPIVAIYSTFMQRAVDQVFQEIALQKLPVILCMDRAGLCGSDGAVHHGFMDIALMRGLPGMVLMSPADEAELNSALDLALSLEGPCALRYPRDEVTDALGPATAAPYRLGAAGRIRAGADGAFLALGAMVEFAFQAAKTLADRHGVETAVYSARFAKPLDESLILDLLESGKPLAVVEDHNLAGGFGSAVLELAAARHLPAGNVFLRGLPDRFIPHATRDEQLAQAGLDAPALASAMLKAMQRLGFRVNNA